MSQETDNAETVEPNTGHETGVGALLHASRERLGEDLRAIAGTLHIRFIYLEAIEEGRFDDLPGTAYVIGFIRSYADYLGLDSAEVVRRFKEEAQAAPDETELVFPVPIPESSIPGGAIVLVGFMVAAVAYGLWYVGTAKDGFFAQMVTPVPQRLAEKVPQPEPKVKPEQPEQPIAEPVVEPEVETEVEPAVEPEIEPVVAKTEPVEAETKPAEPEQPAVSDPPADVEPADVAKVAEQQPEDAPGEAPVEATEEAPPVSEPAEQSLDVEQDDDQVANTSVTDDQSVRIVVVARQNSWIQVRNEASRQLVVTRVLRAGDSYRVPNKPGLKLLTGNAGALDIYVDGQLVPAIGESGAIRRSVALDPERLVQGDAVD